jgi:hypothetical protein
MAAQDYEQVTYNSPSGAQVGQSATEKIGFFGATPVVKQVGAAVPTDLATAITAITALRLALNNLGLTTSV